MKCLYHANCLDGAGAALAVWSAYGDEGGHKYIPCQYGDELPDGLEGHDVIMVDFSAKKEQIRELAQKAKSILIIDHHKTAQEELKDVDDGMGCKITVAFDMDHSGAVLAWKWFHSSDVPDLLLHIEDRDLWKFQMEKTKNICSGLKLHKDWSTWLSLSTTILEEDGRAINEFIKLQAEDVIKNKPMAWGLTGDLVPVYNIPGFMISETLHMALNKWSECPYAVAYFDLPDKRIYSLRSRKGSDVDVSEIAKLHGGGGHKYAAGLSLFFSVFS